MGFNPKMIPRIITPEEMKIDYKKAEIRANNQKAIDDWLNGKITDDDLYSKIKDPEE